MISNILHYTFFVIFLTVQGQQKILSIFCLNGDHYFILKKKDCAALFQCYKFLLNCTFNCVFCNNVMSVWNGWLQQGKNKSKFFGKYICVFFCTDIHVATWWNV